MNRRGNIFLGVALAFFIWISGILMIPFIVDNIDTTRIDLDCTNTAISFGTKTLCLGIDVIIPVVIWTLVVIVLGIIISKN